MTTYDKFTYDLGSLKLSKADKAAIEADFDDAGEYMVCTDETADASVRDRYFPACGPFATCF